MQKTTLNGTWSYRIGRGEWEKIIVPFSRLPVGHSECFRTFDLEQTAEKIFLQFDGITYGARVTLNGQVLGDLLAYAEYRFDVTELVRPTKNELLVELEDIEPKFGPTEGWENFGGIIRDVSILYTGENYITDVFFHAALTNDYTDAEMQVDITADRQGATFLVELFDGEGAVLSYEQGDTTETKTVKSVTLWSPDTPHLYTLKVSLAENGSVTDTYTCMDGFMEFTCDDH